MPTEIEIPFEIVIGKKRHTHIATMKLRVTLDNPGISTHGDAMWDALKENNTPKFLRLIADQMEVTSTPPTSEDK
jgi:hypothetical protein